MSQEDNGHRWRDRAGWDSRGELRLAGRRLSRSPGYALAVVLNLGLGIGVTTGIFVVLQGVLLRPLPYADPERLMVIEHEMPGISMGGRATLFGAFQGQALHYAERSRQIEAVGVFGSYDAAVVEGGAEDSVHASYVRAGYGSVGLFRALSTGVLAGRSFDEAEDTTEGGGAVLLTSSAWARRGRDPGIVETPLRVDGSDRRIVGVLTPQGPFPAERLSLWTLRTEAEIRQTPHVLVRGLLARLREGATSNSLARELDQLIAELPDRIPDDFVRRAVNEGRLRTRITPLTEKVVGTLTGPLYLLFAAAGLVLLAALANVTNLQLLRSEARRGEMAVRSALGARRSDLVRQHLLELAVLAAFAGALALAIADLGLAWLRHAGPADLPRARELSLGAPSFFFASALAGLSALWLAGVASVSRPATHRALHASRSGGRGARRRARVRQLMAVAELAAAVVLLIGAGLLVRSFTALVRVEPGFVPESVLTFRVPFPLREIDRTGGGSRATPFYNRLADHLAGLPGIDAVGYAQCAPLSELCGLEGLTLQRADRPIGSVEHEELFGVLQIGPGYHEALSIPLLVGRHLERRDHEKRTNAVVLSASVAERLFGGEDPLEQRILTPDFPEWSPFTVVGVVDEVRHTALRGAPEAVVYMPVLMRDQLLELWTISFVVRTTVPTLTVVDEIRTALRELRPDIPAAHFETMSDAVLRSTARMRFAVTLLAVAALATLALGATGVYGVIAYAVSLRRGEFGVRLALGADGPALRRLVLLEGAAVALAGLGLGLATALWGSRFLASVLYDITPSDGLTYAVVAGLMVSTALLASELPAQRAARVDPSEVLRAE